MVPPSCAFCSSAWCLRGHSLVRRYTRACTELANPYSAGAIGNAASTKQQTSLRNPRQDVLARTMLANAARIFCSSVLVCRNRDTVGQKNQTAPGVDV